MIYTHELKLLRKPCDRNSVPPLAIAVGNSDVWARGVYSTDAFLFTSYIYIHHFAYFLFLFDWVRYGGGNSTSAEEVLQIPASLP